VNENQNIEYKESWRDEYLKWVCGFANAQGGKILIGVDDKGQVVGLDNSKRLMEEIPNKIVAHLGLVADVNLRKKGTKSYLEIIVQPNTVPISYHGAYHYRSGSTKQELKGTALQQFLLKKIGRTWDDMVVEKSYLNRINSNTLNTFLHFAMESKRISPDAPSHDLESLFAKLHLIDDNGHLKNAAILLFYEDPIQYFSTAYFKIGRFGKSDSDLKFQDVIEGNIFDMPEKVIRILRAKYLISPIRYEGLQRKEDLEYPESALREAILNAVVHKDYTGSSIQLSVYDDKLVLWNPGSLPEDLSIDMLKKKHPSRPRNKNIAEVFFKAGYIEAWGRGISKIMDACRDAGLPEPSIEEYAGGIQITFLKDIFTEDYLYKLNLNERQIKSVLYVKEFKSITNAKYQEINSVSKATATRDLQSLLERKILKNKGSKGAGAEYVLIGS